VSATPSPSASPSAAGETGAPGASAAAAPEPQRRSLIPRVIRRLGPKTLQGRLTLGFAGVVGLTLFLVTVFVLNRLDDQFRRQQLADLNGRTRLVAYVVDTLASERAAGGPVVGVNNVVNPAVAQALGAQAYQQLLADYIAQADVDITLGLEPVDSPDMIGLIPASNGSFQAIFTGEPQPGQTREDLDDVLRRRAQFSPFPYVIQIRLSNPYTFRQSAIGNVTTILAAVGIVALGIAVIVAAAMALRVTTPLRRLTEASRALAEGELGRRIPRADVRAGSSELAALATQFNAMADRLEESVAIIRRDRDRSRDFLADVSHELRTPIAALLTFNELLTERAGSDPKARAEFLDNSRVQLERLDWLAQNLLELSKLDSGLVLLDLRPDDLRAAVESAVEQAGPAAKRRGVQFELSLPSAPLRVRHDPQRIGQVVTNLVGNAIKFSDPGGRVAIAAGPNEDGAWIEVSDTGVGIEPAEMNRIFDRFYRGSLANEARGSGSGLGLAIVRSIVDMHHGHVSVTSQLGRGATFRVELPADPRLDDAAAPPIPLNGSSSTPAPNVVETSPTPRPSLNSESPG
jgi:signal transduction histidine kinase